MRETFIVLSCSSMLWNVEPQRPLARTFPVLAITDDGPEFSSRNPFRLERLPCSLHYSPNDFVYRDEGGIGLRRDFYFPLPPVHSFQRVPVARAVDCVPWVWVRRSCDNRDRALGSALPDRREETHFLDERGADTVANLLQETLGCVDHVVGTPLSSRST